MNARSLTPALAAALVATLVAFASLVSATDVLQDGTDAQLLDCGVSDTVSTAASDDVAVEDPIEDRDCYVLGLDGVDGGTTLSLPGTDCEGTDGPVAGVHFPAGSPRQFYALSGDDPVQFSFTCAGDEITCLELSAQTSKTGGGEASATSACSQTSAHCESPPGSECVDRYVGLHEPGPWHCSLWVHVKWYGGSAHASCSVSYS
jgi:hypothetical protein